MTAVRVQLTTTAIIQANPTMAYLAVYAGQIAHLYSIATDPGAAMASGPASLVDDIHAFAIAAATAGQRAWVIFRGLDELGRSTGVVGKITLENLHHAFGSAASSRLMPVGWKTLKLIDPEGARAHLWAYLFGGPGADRRNIVGMVKSANRLMSNYEGMIESVLQQRRAAAVYYRVTPIYDSLEETVLPVGLKLEAIAVDASDNVIETLFDFPLWNG